MHYWTFVSPPPSSSTCLELQIEASKSTSCWYWIHGTNIVKRAAFWNKLPFQVGPLSSFSWKQWKWTQTFVFFQWLGPFTSKQMQVINFKLPIYSNESKEFWAEEEAQELKRVEPRSQEKVPQSFHLNLFQALEPIVCLLGRVLFVSLFKGIWMGCGTVFPQRCQLAWNGWNNHYTSTSTSNGFAR